MKGVRFDYAGAEVLVAGGSGGIGAAIAAAYRDAGATVTITGTRAAASDYGDLIEGCAYRPLDIESTDSIAALAETSERCDILVNSTGIALMTIGFDEYEPDIFERAVRMHLTGAYRLAHAFRDKLSASIVEGGGSFIGIASLSSYFGIEQVPGYGAAKAGLVQLMKTLAVAWSKHNIRANAVAAGLTESKMTAGVKHMPEVLAPTLARTPMGRLGQPEDLAGPVLFLTSPAAAFVTGQTLLVDGGYSVVG
ncbi:MAG: SDR family oxidoreductase [Proteobacteria bacterium]|nr:SDR family oxidoreductase [Pseudomonadota bacterium]